MIKNNHYNTLVKHVSKLLSGLEKNRRVLPDRLNANISVDFYEQSLLELEKRKKKLDERENEYLQEVKRFHCEYESIRRVLKKDVTKLKREFYYDEELLEKFGVFSRK